MDAQLARHGVVDQRAGIRRVIAARLNLLDVSMAPATNKLVAELLDGAVPHLEPAPYAASRF